MAVFMRGRRGIGLRPVVSTGSTTAGERAPRRQVCGHLDGLGDCRIGRGSGRRNGREDRSGGKCVKTFLRASRFFFAHEKCILTFFRTSRCTSKHREVHLKRYPHFSMYRLLGLRPIWERSVTQRAPRRDIALIKIKHSVMVSVLFFRNMPNIAFYYFKIRQILRFIIFLVTFAL